MAVQRLQTYEDPFTQEYYDETEEYIIEYVDESEYTETEYTEEVIEESLAGLEDAHFSQEYYHAQTTAAPNIATSSSTGMATAIATAPLQRQYPVDHGKAHASIPTNVSVGRHHTVAAEVVTNSSPRRQMASMNVAAANTRHMRNTGEQTIHHVETAAYYEGQNRTALISKQSPGRNRPVGNTVMTNSHGKAQATTPKTSGGHRNEKVSEVHRNNNSQSGRQHRLHHEGEKRIRPVEKPSNEGRDNAIMISKKQNGRTNRVESGSSAVTAPSNAPNHRRYPVDRGKAQGTLPIKASGRHDVVKVDVHESGTPQHGMASRAVPSANQRQNTFQRGGEQNISRAKTRADKGMDRGATIVQKSNAQNIPIEAGDSTSVARAHVPAKKRRHPVNGGPIQTAIPSNTDGHRTAQPSQGHTNAAPQGGMSAMIAAAANDRQNRLGKGGEPKISQVERPSPGGLGTPTLMAKKTNSRKKRSDASSESSAAAIRHAAMERRDPVDRGNAQTSKPPSNGGRLDARASVTDANGAPRGGMFAMIAAAANKRQNRLGKGGEPTTSHVEQPSHGGVERPTTNAKKTNGIKKRLGASDSPAAAIQHAANVRQDPVDREHARTSQTIGDAGRLDIRAPVVDSNGAPRGGMAVMLAAAVHKRQNRLNSGGEKRISHVEKPPGNAQTLIPRNVVDRQGTEPAVFDTTDAPPQGGMAAMIAAAAHKRQNRLHKGGEKKITHVEKRADEGLDMVAMIAKKANERNKRIDAGGELKVTEVRDIPDEHKNVYVDIALEAARIGILTRLHEHTVEGVAGKKKEKVWAGPSGLRTDHLRSDMFMAINEAAALGKMKGSKPVEVTSYDQNVRTVEKEVEDIDKMKDEHGRRVIRQLYLIDRQLDEERKSKEEEWSAEKVQNIIRYENWEDVELPSETPPKWRPPQSNGNHRDLMEAISHGVAERAWERNYRLNRPKANLKLTRKCKCRFCVNPNPYQTHKYKKIEEIGNAEDLRGPIKPIAAPIADPVVELTIEEIPRNEEVPELSTSTSTPEPVPPMEHMEEVNQAPRSLPVPQHRRAPEPKLRHVGMDYIYKEPFESNDDFGYKEPVTSSDDDAHGVLSEPATYYDSTTTVTILLDETITWSHKRQKKPRKRKKASKDQNYEQGCGCMIM